MTSNKLDKNFIVSLFKDVIFSNRFEGPWSSQRPTTSVGVQANFHNLEQRGYPFKNGRVEWFSDGLLNASENCIDVHLESKGDQLAFIWEGDEPDQIETITYKGLIKNSIILLEIRFSFKLLFFYL